MSVKVNYKGEEILSIGTDATKKLTTRGQYCEDDIEIVNTQNGGITPSGSQTFTQNGTYDVTALAEAVVNVSSGASYVDVMLTQNYTSGASIISALKSASGFTNLFAKIISTIPESGACTTNVINAPVPNGTWQYLYRRSSADAWGGANPGTQSAYSGDIFRVWEVE